VSHRVRGAVGLLLLASLTVPAAAAPEVEVAQQLPEPPFYALRPHDPYPLIRVCSTPQGICAVPVCGASALTDTSRWPQQAG
jgi:hypothetical protein